MGPEQRLHEIGLRLPIPATPSFRYIAVKRCAELAYLSGQLPKENGEVRVRGKVGAEVSVEQACHAARICVLQGLACLKQEIGDLGQIRQIVKLTGFVASASDFYAQPQVIDAASELLTDVFADAGRHARSAVGVASLPRNAAVEIELIVQLHGEKS